MNVMSGTFGANWRSISINGSNLLLLKNKGQMLLSGLCQESINIGVSYYMCSVNVPNIANLL